MSLSQRPNNKKLTLQPKITPTFPPQVLIGDECLIRFSGVSLGSACTVVIRGATQQVLDEAERSLHDALCVLTATVREPKTIFGGGNEPFIRLECDSFLGLVGSACLYACDPWLSRFWTRPDEASALLAEFIRIGVS